MHESSSGFLHLDYPFDGATLPTGPIVLRGWAAGPKGSALVDLRLRHGETVHTVVLGFPRADLAAHFGLRDQFLPGGFEAKLVLVAGENTLVFEALGISGQWSPLGSIRLIGHGGAPTVISPPAQLIQPHEFARALQFTLRRANDVPIAKAATELAAALPQPAILRFPHAPLHGHLHEPAVLERVLFGRLCVSGWLFHEIAALRRVVATVDMQTWQDLKHGGEVPYVTAQFPQFATSRQCAISGWIDVPSQLPSPLCVRIYAQLEDQSWHLCQVQRTHTRDQEQEKTAFSPVGFAGFAKLVLTLRRECRARGFELPWSRPLWQGISGVYREYRAHTRPTTATPVSSVPATIQTSPAPRLEHVTLVTHNLGLEGAPLFLVELARHLAASGTKLRVISAMDGPLAAVYAGLGSEVQQVDIGALAAAQSVEDLDHEIDRLGNTLKLDDTSLVIANTLSAYWGVHLAQRAGRPSLFYIHESTTPASFYLGHTAPATLPLIEATFRLATQVSFLTEATRAYYRPWLGATNHSIHPGWIDLQTIDAWLANNSRESLRQKLGLPPGVRLIVNVGTVCNRKGQHIFARAVDLFTRRHPAEAETCRFLMIGGHDTLFDHDLKSLLAQMNHPNVQIVAATSQPLVYYGAADLFVCSSYEESFPRVIMEAMACQVPILSTAVHGIRDMLTSGMDSWLIPAGDSHALACGLEHMLSHPVLAREYAARARARVVASYDAAHLLPQHAALAARVGNTLS